jgi:hypothetical protein
MKKKDLERVEEWLENNGYEVYADRNDELPTEGVAELLQGNDEKFNDAISDIESNFWDYIEWDSHKDDCISALGLDEDVKEDADFIEAFDEGKWLDMSDWIKSAARNTRLHITATPYTGEPLKPGERLFEEDQDERLFLFPHGYCSDEENDRRRQKLMDVLGVTPDGDSNMYEFDELKVLGTLDIADIIANGPPTHITIGPDTPNEMLAHNAVNGSGGMGEIKPTKTVTLPAMFEVDQPRYGVDAVYGFVGEVWARPLPASRVEVEACESV